MKRFLLAVTVTLSVALLAYGFSQRTSPQYDSIHISTKADPSHGIAVISPSDPAFDEKMAALTAGDKDLRRLVEAAKPFSLFVKNESDKDIVGCSLTWELAKGDGTAVTLGNSYTTPAILMGEEPADPSLANKTSLIPANSVTFLSLDPLVKEYVDVSVNNSGSTASLSSQSRQFMKNYAIRLQGEYEKLVKSVVNVTSSIDGAVFSDGLFVGPDTNKMFTYLQARIDAKRDVALSVEEGLKQKKNSAETLKSVEEISKKPRASHNPRASLEEYYAYVYDESLHSYADELLRIKDTRGDDLAVEHTHAPLHKAWPQLRKEF